MNTSDTDLSSRNTDFFGSLGFGFGRLLINGKYYFQSIFDVKNQNAQGDSIKFGEAYNSCAF